MSLEEVAAIMGPPSIVFDAPDGTPRKWYFNQRKDPVIVFFDNGKLSWLLDQLQKPKSPALHPVTIQLDQQWEREAAAKAKAR